MSWKSWSKPKAVDARAKALEDEELALERQMRELQEQVETLKNPPAPPPNQPVWRAPKSTDPHSLDPSETISKKLVHPTNRAQQKQDRNLFIMLLAGVCFVLFLVLRNIMAH